MKRLWQERSPPLPHFDSLPRPGSLPLPTAAAPPPVPTPAPDSDRKVKRLKLTGASLGSSATKIRLGGPSTSTPAPPSAPSTPGITLKLGGRTAASNVAPPASNSVDSALPALPSLHLPNLPVHPVPSTSHLNQEVGDTPGRKRADRSVSAIPHKSSKKKGKQAADPDGEGEGDEEHGGPPLATVPDPESGWMGGDVVSFVFSNSSVGLRADLASKSTLL